MLHVCIAGVGLIGGSLGMALRGVRQNGHRKYSVMGWGRSTRALRQAKKRGAIDDFTTNSRVAVVKADVVVLSVPVHHIENVLKKFRSHLKKGAIVTDVGSIKSAVHAQAKSVLASRRDVKFVGGHPLAGSEKAGVENAEKQLFRKANVVLTKNGSSTAAFKIVRTMWHDVGAKSTVLSSRDHDDVLSLTSHLPHLLAFALFGLTRGRAKKNRVIKSLVAGSFRDMTRIAASDPKVWTGILEMNRGPIKNTAREFLKELNRLVSTPDSKIEKTLRSIANAKKAW